VQRLQEAEALWGERLAAAQAAATAQAEAVQQAHALELAKAAEAARQQALDAEARCGTIEWAQRVLIDTRCSCCWLV
jgi:hypothetical protein